MEFESELARNVADRNRNRGGQRKFVAGAISLVFLVSVFAMLPKANAEIVVVDEVNIGCVQDEADHSATGWSATRWCPLEVGNWGGFDMDDPFPEDAAYTQNRNLRTVLGGEEDPSTGNWAKVTLVTYAKAKLLELRALDGIADDSFEVYVNDNIVYSYRDKAPIDDPEAWSTHRFPVKGEGTLVVKLVAKAAPWWGQSEYGQVAVNWMKLYGVLGFDVFGYNYPANVFNGWYGYYDRSIEGGWVAGTGDAWLLMKWSEDWTPMINEPIGAWCTNHWSWYSNDYDEATWYGFNTRMAWDDSGIPDAAYKVTEFMKIMKVGDNPEEWERYAAGGAYDAGWGSYWHVTGTWTLTFEYGGDWVHDVTIVSQDETGALTGYGSYPAGSTTPSRTWVVTSGQVTGNNVWLNVSYTSGDPGYTFAAVGKIAAADGSISGTLVSNRGHVGPWYSSEGAAWSVPMYVVYQDTVDVYDATSGDWIIGFDLCLTSPKGLGQPIF